MFYLGVDVSKAKLDCMLLDRTTNKVKAKSIPNTSAGFTQLIEWLAKNKAPDAYIVMEPTGVYHEPAALALTDAGLTLSLVNPAQLRQIIRHDEPPAFVERHLFETIQRQRTRIAVEIAAQLDRQPLFAVQLLLKLREARQAEAHQTRPAIMLGKAQDAPVGTVAHCLAERGRQHEPAFVAHRRKGLSVICNLK